MIGSAELKVPRSLLRGESIRVFWYKAGQDDNISAQETSNMTPGILDCDEIHDTGPPETW